MHLLNFFVFHRSIFLILRRLCFVNSSFNTVASFTTNAKTLSPLLPREFNAFATEVREYCNKIFTMERANKGSAFALRRKQISQQTAVKGIALGHAAVDVEAFAG
ncbi:MAG: hypothetical protein AAGK14_12010, partial [Verrucomicrobiota bacterium]